MNAATAETPRFADPLRRNIARLCEARGWSRSELALRSGKSRSQISKVLNGDTALGENWIQLFADTFGIEPRELWPAGTPAQAPSPALASLVGRVGAGGRVTPGGKAAGAGDETAIAVPEFLAPRGDYLVAIIEDPVEMYPMERGWKLFFLPASLGLCLGRICLVTLRGGDLVVKRVRGGDRATIDLEHFSPMIAPIRGAGVERTCLLAGIDTGIEGL